MSTVSKISFCYFSLKLKGHVPFKIFYVPFKIFSIFLKEFYEKFYEHETSIKIHHKKM